MLEDLPDDSCGRVSRDTNIKGAGPPGPSDGRRRYGGVCADGTLGQAAQPPATLPEDASSAAMKWIREHCAGSGLELLRMDSYNDRYPEDQQPYFTLLRFAVARTQTPSIEDWELPTVPPASGRKRRRTTSAEDSKRAA
jgi:hypothetical protein